MNNNENQQNETEGITDTPITFICKVILNSDDFPQSNKQWTRAKKSKLHITGKGLSYEDYFVPFSEIKKATINIYKSALFMEYSILSIKHGETTHYFGLKYTDYWKGELPFALKTIHKDTPFLLYRKSLIILIVIYILWQVVK